MQVVRGTSVKNERFTYWEGWLKFLAAINGLIGGVVLSAVLIWIVTSPLEPPQPTGTVALAVLFFASVSVFSGHYALKVSRETITIRDGVLSHRPIIGAPRSIPITLLTGTYHGAWLSKLRRLELVIGSQTISISASMPGFDDLVSRVIQLGARVEGLERSRTLQECPKVASKDEVDDGVGQPID